jgi:uncharacterized protein YndB with AHSA1/START domain
MGFKILSYGIFIAFCSGSITAAVTDSAANGFVVKTSVTIQAAPDEVYRRIVNHVGDWWSSDHTFSGNSHNLSIEEKPMGCFCEKLPNGGGVRHMEVVNFVPGKSLVMSGALGPLQSMAASANMTVQLTSNAGVAGGAIAVLTRVDVTYAVTGYLAGGINALAAPVDGVIGQQFARLKNLIERGSPEKADGR